MPPIKSQEALEGLSPEESARQKVELIRRAEYAADIMLRISAHPPVPDEEYTYYAFGKSIENNGAANLLLKIAGYDVVNDEHIETPLVQFHRSVEVEPENRKSGVTLKHPREIRVPVIQNEQTEWVAVEPGTHIYDNVEDTISYIEQYIRMVENSFLDRIASAISNLAFFRSNQS